jgi:arylsulfatase A-like enzyme/Tfp pilus assembly protein PilF
VLLITVDTLRADALGAYGRRGAHTPWIDRLAADGVRFDRARAHNVVTLPSHANILSGRYPLAHGIRDNAGFRLPASTPTLATILKARGYRTAAFVSAFPLDSRFGLDRGFDVYDDGFGGGAQKAFLVQERVAKETVARAKQWLDAQGDAPLLCWVHLYEPHFPYAPPEPFASRFRESPYDGEVAATDEALRPLLDPLLTASDSNTLVVFTSDHGESLGEHGEATHGIFAYDASLRVPLVIHNPRQWSSSTVSEPVGHVDVLPTILDALGVPLPADLDGRSVLPLLTGAQLPPRVEYFEAMSGSLNRGWAPLQGLVAGGFKFIDLPIPELYDLESDPSETHNLARDQPRRLDELKVALERLAVPAGTARVENPDTRERLRSLGYVGGATAARKAAYTEDDDPKRLIALDRLLEEVIGRYLGGDAAGALERCRNLVRQRPEMAVSWLHLAHLERETGNLQGGIEALEKAAALNPDEAETLALLGAYLTEAGRAREAVERLESSADHDSPDVGVLVSYALALARLGETQKARTVLVRAQDIDPSDAMLHVQRGTVELIGNDRTRARVQFEAALARSPDLPRAHSSLGILLAEDGRTREAAAHWDRAGAADPREYRTIFAVGFNLARRGDPRARPFLEYFAAKAPSSMYARELQAAAALLAR